jgi:hypothetical protein
MKFTFDNIKDSEKGKPFLEDDELLEDENFFEEEEDFLDNLALNFPEAGLNRLSSYLIDSIEEDIAARKEWIDVIEKVRNNLGFKVESFETTEYMKSSKNFTGVLDATLGSALIRSSAMCRAELLPDTGPAGYRVIGPSNDFIEEKGEINRDYINYNLTIVDKGFYPDFERHIFNYFFEGSGVRKVYYDKILQRPISRSIKSADFIIDADCSSILDSTRITHILHLNKREILFNLQNNIFRDVKLPYLKSEGGDLDDNDNENNKNDVDLNVYSKSSRFPFYESHVYLNLEDFRNSNNNETKEEIPLPYRVRIDKITKQIVEIRRNWREDDPLKKRREFFVLYNFLPGFGLFGLGYAQICGANAIAATKLLQILIDAGVYRNLQGGFKVKSKQQNNNLTAGPGQWIDIETNAMPIRDFIAPFPFNEPSNTLRELRLEVVNSIKEAIAATDAGIMSSKEDIPAATIYAILEQNNRVQTAVMKSIHCSFSQELQLLNELFSETLEHEEFQFGERVYQISNEDFLDEVKIIPISDPAVNSSFQRLVQAEYLLKTASTAPDLHNMRCILEKAYKAIGLDDNEVQEVLKPDPTKEEVLPVNPINEVMNILLGKPVKAAIWQNHPAHIVVLGAASMRPEMQGREDMMASLNALITEHQAYQYLVEMQQLLGTELSLEEEQDPQTQNSIALVLAQKLIETGATNVEEEQQQAIDPNMVMMADIQQKEREVEAKERIANLKAETDIFKTQMDFEKEKMKVESNEDIAVLKSDTELTKQEYQDEP